MLVDELILRSLRSEETRSHSNLALRHSALPATLSRIAGAGDDESLPETLAVPEIEKKRSHRNAGR